MNVLTKVEGNSLVLWLTGKIDPTTAKEGRSHPSSLDSSQDTKELFDVTVAFPVDCVAWGEFLPLVLTKVKQGRV